MIPVLTGFACKSAHMSLKPPGPRLKPVSPFRPTTHIGSRSWAGLGPNRSTCHPYIQGKKIAKNEGKPKYQKKKKKKSCTRTDTLLTAHSHSDPHSYSSSQNETHTLYIVREGQKEGVTWKKQKKRKKIVASSLNQVSCLHSDMYSILVEARLFKVSFEVQF